MNQYLVIERKTRKDVDFWGNVFNMPDYEMISVHRRKGVVCRWTNKIHTCMTSCIKIEVIKTVWVPE